MRKQEKMVCMCAAGKPVCLGELSAALHMVVVGVNLSPYLSCNVPVIPLHHLPDLSLPPAACSAVKILFFSFTL